MALFVLVLVGVIAVQKVSNLSRMPAGLSGARKKHLKHLEATVAAPR